MVATDITNDTPEPIDIYSRMQSRPDWPKWQIDVNGELYSLISQHTFGPVEPTP